jgi:glutamyl-tRNA synthetase
LKKGTRLCATARRQELNELREARREAGKATALKPSDLMLSADEQAARKAAGDPYVIRMMVPEDEGACAIEDMLRGTIELDWSMVDAQILMKSDGLPTYHLANVVDDHLMEITHVIRGEEWINSAPKHQLLYEYFGWQMPVLCHLPLLRNPDKSKLSKRKNPTSILYYQRMGFLPEALVNYLGRMGWSMPNEEEKFTLAEMQAAFDISRVSLGGPIFDIEKLKWLNGLWIRESLTQDELANRLYDWALNPEMLGRILPHAQGRIEVLSDLIPQAAYLLSWGAAYHRRSVWRECRDTRVRDGPIAVCFVAIGGAAGLVQRCIVCGAQRVGRGHVTQTQGALCAPFCGVVGPSSGLLHT